MNIGKVFLVWLVANVFIGLLVLIYTLIGNDVERLSVESILSVGLVGFVCTIPSLIVLIIFQAIYKSTVKTPNKLHYILLVLGINVLYTLFCKGAYDIRYSKQYFFFFIITTISGVAAVLIFYKQPKPVYNEQHEFGKGNTVANDGDHYGSIKLGD